MGRSWRESHKIIEHALGTLSKFEIDILASDPAGFEASEFPLLISDMQEALDALRVSCERMERAQTDQAWAEGPIARLKQANHG